MVDPSDSQMEVSKSEVGRCQLDVSRHCGTQLVDFWVRLRIGHYVLHNNVGLAQVVALLKDFAMSAAFISISYWTVSVESSKSCLMSFAARLFEKTASLGPGPMCFRKWVRCILSILTSFSLIASPNPIHIGVFEKSDFWALAFGGDMVANCVPDGGCVVAFEQSRVAFVGIEIDALSRFEDNSWPSAIEAHAARHIEESIEVARVVRQLQYELLKSGFQTQIDYTKCWDRKSDCSQEPSNVEADEHTIASEMLENESTQFFSWVHHVTFLGPGRAIGLLPTVVRASETQYSTMSIHED